MKQILIIDDEFDIQLLFVQQFEEEISRGVLRFEFVRSAEEALIYLRKLSKSDLILILSDINMPGMTGLELLRVIKAEMPNLPVAMVTAYGDEINRQKADAYGADAFITKPINFSLIKDIIKSYSTRIESKNSESNN